MYRLSILIVFVALLGAEEVQVEKPTVYPLKVEYTRIFTKNEIAAMALNPEVILCYSQAIVVLPTGERILYTTIQTKNEIKTTINGAVLNFHVTTTTTLLPPLPPK